MDVISETSAPLGVANIRRIQPYVPGKTVAALAHELGCPETAMVNLGANENPLGMSPRAREAIAAYLPVATSHYPDADAVQLRSALSRHLQVDTAWITMGNGSSDLIDLAARCFLEAGRKAVISQYAFASYATAIFAAGGIATVVPAKDFGHDLDAMLHAVDAETRLVYIANPNNPTGSVHSGDDLLRFVQSVPPHVAVVLDEAYIEYMAEDRLLESLGWIAAHPNLLVLRTFSKIYGLASLRMGYAITHPSVAQLLHRVRLVFNTSTLSQVAATAALEDREFVSASREANSAGMVQLQQGLHDLGVQTLDSAGNFVLARVGDARAVAQQMLRSGVVVRSIHAYGLPEWVRITVGTRGEISRCLDSLKTALRPDEASGALHGLSL